MKRISLLALLAIAACAPKPAATTTTSTSSTATPVASAVASPTPARKFAKGNIETTAVCQLYVDGWDALSPKQRVYAYHLARASWAGRDLFYDQMHPRGLDVRQLLEAIVSAPEKVDPAALAKIQLHLRKIWVDSSMYDGHTGQKIKPTYTRAELLAAAKAAGVTAADKRVTSLAAFLFDPAVDPVLTARAPVGKKDIVQASAVNFYEGVTQKQVESIKAVYGLNSTVVVKNGKVTEEPWRTQAPGRYAKELGRVNESLKAARELASPDEQAVIDPLIELYTTGDYEKFRQYSIAWLKADPQIEWIHGFIETYDDPRGEKGSFEGFVFAPAEKLSTRMRALGGLVVYLEGKAPWDAKYKKEKIEPPVAKAVQLVFAAGDGGKAFPVGINLPNPQDIRETYGSKSIYISNIAECADAINTASMLGEFALPEDRDEIKRWGMRGSETHVALHEVAGHASGKVSPALKDDPRAYLKEYYATLEEARADLVSLWNLGDEKLIAAGVVEAKETRRAYYKLYTMNVLANLRRAPEGDVLHEDHLRNRQMIVHYAMEKGAADKVVREGKTYFRMTDEAKFHAAVGELLAEVMRIKAEGDYEKGKALVETYGSRFDPKLRDEVVARSAAAGVPSAFFFQPPRLVPVKDPNGVITDVELAYDETFDEFQLRMSRGND